MEDRSGVQTGKKSRLYHYRDARGNTISSLIPLECPLYVGDIPGTVAETKQRLRGTVTRVAGVEGRVGSVEERLATLELENRALKEQVRTNHEGVSAFAAWLRDMVAEHVHRGGPVVPLTLEGETHQLPPPVARLIVDLGAVVAEVEGVEVTSEE